MVSLMENITTGMSEEEVNCLFATGLAVGAVLPMVLKSAIELDLLELIKKSNGSNASPSELAAQLPTKNPQAATMIDRILRLLSSHSILKCSIETLPDGRVERRYSLAPICKFLTKNEDGVSLAPFSLLCHDKIFMESWYYLKDAVLEGGIPFNLAHGTSTFEYIPKDPRADKIFNVAMSDQATLFIKKILEKYNGFEGLKSLVDVGGGNASTLNQIISKYPSIKGIDFDLPHVIQGAYSFPGVEHVSGDMFVSVPKADAIFMKWILHDWDDEHCKILLKNCYEALPENGKVIIAEYVFPEDPNAPNYVALADLFLLAYISGGKERTEKEFEALAKGAGFKNVVRVCCAYNVWILEFHK